MDGRMECLYIHLFLKKKFRDLMVFQYLPADHFLFSDQRCMDVYINILHILTGACVK